ncbi:MAG: DUF1830 domain-containing protein [Cyanobacteria bacterium SID2]|nr:DUF1830 domain-containing protein [Cyanobacteria bacterium SID2]MBP0004503.1 DUF1830 domain-containing protein [Cyanobacteria bacterium SBC]
MAQILDPLPKDSSNPVLCCYVNATSQIQVARITNISNWYFERVVFPGQRLVFETMPQAQLEIHTGMMASAILSDTIPCERLKVTTDFDGMKDSTAKEESDSVKNREVAAASSHDTKKPVLASVE